MDAINSVAGPRWAVLGDGVPRGEIAAIAVDKPATTAKTAWSSAVHSDELHAARAEETARAAPPSFERAIELARAGVAPTRAELISSAEAAQAAYGDGVPPEMRRIIPGSLGVPETSSRTGLRAAVYERNTDGAIVVAFAGTEFDDIKDWLNNGEQALGGIPPQYLQAVELVAAAKEKYGDRVQVVGHSLGGGLAAFAGLLCGVRTHTFNAAGLGAGARVWAWADGKLDANRALITNVNLADEGLTSEAWIEHPLIRQERIGRVLELPPPDPTPGLSRPFDRLEKRVLHDHSMDQVLRALRSSSELREVRKFDERSDDGLATRLGQGVVSAVVEEVGDAAASVAKETGKLAWKVAARGAALASTLADAAGVTELMDGDARVKSLGAEGRKREAVVATFETVGAFSGAVADAALGAARRVPLLGRILSEFALKEGGRAVGGQLGRAINDAFEIEDRRANDSVVAQQRKPGIDK